MATLSPGNPGELHVLNQPPSDGEIGFLWRYLRRDAIDNRTFEAVRDQWGMCERHAFAMLAVAASIPRSGLHSVTALYAALMGQACAVAESRGPLNDLRSWQALRSTGPCPMCELGLSAVSPGAVHRSWLVFPRGLRSLRAFMTDTKPYWSKFVCSQCSGQGTNTLCRNHILAELDMGHERVIEEQKPLFNALRFHLDRFRQAFLPDYIGTAADEDRGAVIAAAGWCTGWNNLLRMNV